jgi:hypothetical protein
MWSSLSVTSGTPDSSTNKTDRQDILLKVALNTTSVPSTSKIDTTLCDKVCQ